VRALKIAGLSSAAVLGLLLVFIGLFAWFFNPNDYKPRLEALVKAQTGRAFTLQGELRLQVVPMLALEASQFALGDLPMFGAEPLLRAETAAVRLRWLPLLQRRVALDGIEVRGVQLHLIRTADGGSNWEDLLKRLAQPSPQKASASQRLAFDRLSDFKLDEARVHYEDHTATRDYRVEHLNLHARDVRLGQAFEWDGAATLVADTQLALQWRSQVLLNVSEQHYAVSALQVQGHVSGATWPATGVPLKLSAAQVRLDQRAGRAQLDDWRVEFGTARANGTASMVGLNDRAILSGDIEIAPLSLREWLSQIGKPLPTLRDGNALNAFALRGDLQATTNSLQLRLSELTMDETHMTGDINVDTMPERRWQFALHADRMNVDRYSSAAPTKDPVHVPLDWLRSIAARGTLSIDQAEWQGIRTRNLVLHLDE